MSANEKEAVERLRKFVFERRHHKKLRQQDLAERSGVSMGWVGMLESGKLKSQPRSDTLHKVTKALLLPNEHHGGLFQFLEFVMAGSIHGNVARQVAIGKKSFDEVFKELLGGQAGAPPSEADQASALFFDRESRSHHLETMLKWLRNDLDSEDFDLASKLLKRLYDGVSIESEPVSRLSAPRRRTPRATT